MNQNSWRKTRPLSFYICKCHNSKCPTSTLGCHTSLLTFYAHADGVSCILNNCKNRNFVPMEAIFFITLLNLILIRPSVLWTVAKLCTCGRKLPHTALCKTGQGTVAPQAPVASEPRRGRRQQQQLGWPGDGECHPTEPRQEAAGSVTGWKSNM